MLNVSQIEYKTTESNQIGNCKPNQVRNCQSNIVGNRDSNQVGNSELNQVRNSKSNQVVNGGQRNTESSDDGAHIRYLTRHWSGYRSNGRVIVVIVR